MRASHHVLPRFATGPSGSKVLQLKLATQTDRPARDHKLAFAEIVERFWALGRTSHVRPYNFPNEQPVARSLACISQPALEVGVAFFDEWGFDLLTRDRSKPELLELVYCLTRTVADAYHRVDKRGGRQVDHALLTPAQQLEAVITLPDVAT